MKRIILALPLVTLMVALNTAAARPRCSDGKDNDHDRRTDYPRDPGCKSRRDNDERNRRIPRVSAIPKITVVPAATAVFTSAPVPALPTVMVDPIITTIPAPPIIPTVSGPVVGGDLNNRRAFPDSNVWNQDISSSPVDPNSQTLIASMGTETGLHPDFGTVWDGAPIGIPYVVVPKNQPKVPVSFDYASESELGPYPIPPNPPIEGGPNGNGDRHMLMVDAESWKLYELFAAYKTANGWHAGSGAIYDLNSNEQRPAGWTSADAAGLPVFPGLVRYDEVMRYGEIRHALRFTAARTRRGYVFPARHHASSDTSAALPPMGMRVRLKASFDISPFPAPVQVILRALKKYGMILADNGANWYMSGSPDSRWNDNALRTLGSVKGRDFEVVAMGPVTTD